MHLKDAFNQSKVHSTFRVYIWSVHAFFVNQTDADVLLFELQERMWQKHPSMQNV